MVLTCVALVTRKQQHARKQFPICYLPTSGGVGNQLNYDRHAEIFS